MLGFCSLYFNSQGAFKAGSDPSLSQSLRVHGATFHSPRPLWGLRFTWRTPTRTREKPRQMLRWEEVRVPQLRSQGTTTVKEKIILMLVEMERKVLFRTITIYVQTIAAG